MAGSSWGEALLAQWSNPSSNASTASTEHHDHVVLEDVTRRVCVLRSHLCAFAAAFCSQYCRFISPGIGAPIENEPLPLFGVALLHRTLSILPQFSPCDHPACCGPCSYQRPLAAIVCNDGLLLALAEMSCLMLGIPFYPQFPTDPPLRREALQQKFNVAVSFSESALEETFQRVMGMETVVASERDVVDVSVPDHHVAYVITTSGTTGEPKGVVAERGNLRSYIEGFVAKQHFSQSTVGRHHGNVGVDAPPTLEDEGALGLCVTPSSRLLMLSSCTFDPSIADIATCLYVLLPDARGRLLCASRDDIQSSLASVLARSNPTHVVSTPALWQTVTGISEHGLPPTWIADWTNASTAVVALGGEPMPPQIVSTWSHRVKLFNIYGVTEVTVYQTLQRVVPTTDRSTAVSPAAGHSPRAQAVWIDTLFDSQSNAECRKESVKRGEVVLTGPQVCRGYFSDFCCTKEISSTTIPTTAFCLVDTVASTMVATHSAQVVPLVSTTPVRAFRTGDEGALHAPCIHPCGASLRLFGRRDTIVKIHGQRVALAEVENTILSLLGPSCTGAACLEHIICGMVEFPPSTCDEAEVGGGRGTPATPVTFLSAVVVVKRNEAAPADVAGDIPSLAAAVSTRLWAQALGIIAGAHLPSHMIPVRWLALAAGAPLPCTSSGKINRKQVLDLLLQKSPADITGESGGVPSSTQSWASSLSSLGQLIAREWAALFLTPMKATSHFFRLGGDSLGALKMTRAVYLATHKGDTSAIDVFGIMPEMFKPFHVAQHPTLGEYIEFIESALTDDEPVLPEMPLEHQPRDNGDENHDVADPQDSASSEPTSGTPDDASITRRREAGLLLMEAVDEGDATLVSLLVHPQFGIASPNGLATNNKVLLATTPLHMAVASRHIDVVRVLIRAGAKVTAVNQDGVSPAHIAAMHPTSNVFLRTLVASGFPPQARDRRQQSLLHVAARFGSAVCAHYLLTECQIFPGIRDCWQRTAAHWAVLNGHQGVLQILVDPQWRDESKYYVQVRRGGKSTRERSARLAHRRTHLPYETVAEMAVRLYGSGSEMATAAACLVD